MYIKICGLRKPEEAEYLNRNRVDLAGMVLFLPERKRNITLAQAKEIRAALDPSIRTVAVTISPTLAQARQAEEAGFDLIQIHGEIPPGYAERIGIPVLKAFNVRDLDRFEEYRNAEYIQGFVMDAAEPGSGKTFDWNILKSLEWGKKQCFLSGGLTPENVHLAIGEVHPDGVDVSTGVELPDGSGKDEEKIDRFVAAVREIHYDIGSNHI